MRIRIVRRNSLFFLIFFFLLAGGVMAVESEIHNFGKVDENLYRGAQPEMDEFQQLADQGIEVVINFRAGKDDEEKALIEEEKKAVEAAGMEYISIPWTIYGSFKPEAYSEFMQYVEQKDEKPVFFHCRRGAERTGVFSAVYNMREKGLSYKEAYEDAKKYDLHWLWVKFVKSKIKSYAAHDYSAVGVKE